MGYQEYVHIFDGLAGAAALYLGLQVKQAVKVMAEALRGHETRIARLEHKKRR